MRKMIFIILLVSCQLFATSFTKIFFQEIFYEENLNDKNTSNNLNQSTSHISYRYFHMNELFDNDKASISGFILGNVNEVSIITTGFPIYVTDEQISKIIAKGKVGQLKFGVGNYSLQNIPTNVELRLICFSPYIEGFLGIVPFIIHGGENQKRVDLELNYQHWSVSTSGHLSNSPADALVQLISLITNFAIQKKQSDQYVLNKALAEYLMNIEDDSQPNDNESNDKQLIVGKFKVYEVWDRTQWINLSNFIGSKATLVFEFTSDGKINKYDSITNQYSHGEYYVWEKGYLIIYKRDGTPVYKLEPY